MATVSSKVITESIIVSTTLPEFLVMPAQPVPSTNLLDGLVQLVVSQFNTTQWHCVELVIRENKSFDMLRPLLDNLIGNLVIVAGPDRASPYKARVDSLAKYALDHYTSCTASVADIL